MGWKSLVIFISVTVVTGQLQESRIINNSNRDRPPVLLPKGDLRDFQLFENIPVGTHVYTLKGQDPEGGSVRYTISGDYFSADSVTGKLTLVKELDRELLSEINVVITVQDEQNIVPASRRIKGEFISILRDVRGQKCLHGSWVHSRLTPLELPAFPVV